MRWKFKAGIGLWESSLLLLVFLLLTYATLPTQADPDLWGHIRCGLDVIESGHILQTDIYSYTAAGTPTFDHEWFGEVVFAYIWRRWGDAGLVFLKIGLAVLTGVLCYWHLRKSRVAVHPSLAVLLLLLPLLPPFVLVRPLEFSLPAFALTLILMNRAEEGHWAELWVLPPVFAIWANLHGGFLAALGLFGLWSLWHIRDRLCFPFLASLGATCLNPHGWALVPFLLKTAAVPRPEITEWQPLRASSEYGLMYLAVLTISITGVALSPREKSWRLLAVLGLCAVLPFIAIRHTTLAVLGLVVLAGPYAADLVKTGPPLALPRWAPALPFACAAIVAFAAIRQPVSIKVSPVQFPVAAADVLVASGVEGNLIHQFTWGEYLIWRLAPKMKVMTDGRRESVYSDAAYEQYLHFQNGTGDWERPFRKAGAEVALLEKDSVALNLLRLKPEWTEVYADQTAVLLVRKGTVSARRLEAALQVRGTATVMFRNFNPPVWSP